MKSSETVKYSEAVRRATHRALENRDRLVAHYPAWEKWRREIRAAKAEMVARWPHYLELLGRQVQHWGGEVHFAPTAAAAREFIAQVARRHGVSRVVQAKSMTAHEIGLAPFLAARGIALTETDIGEFIVQVAGHAPAHLTAPALHLNRHHIARILKERLAWDAPPDPAALVRLITAHLEQCYGEAGMGITGVNFAAVEEGILVCLENEGNLGRCATGPPVHLALMGWDKMLPQAADLAPALRLLPASATGQRLTALVHFLKGRKPTASGCQAFYLVIVDNGRSRLAAHPGLREALHCLRCGACLNICPVFQVAGAHPYGRVYPGAIGALLAPFLPPPGDLSDFCTQCGACGDLCPAGIPLPENIRLLRQASEKFRHLRPWLGTAGLVLSHPRLYRPLEKVFHALAQGTGRRWTARIAGLEVPPRSFHSHFQARPLPEPPKATAGSDRRPSGAKPGEEGRPIWRAPAAGGVEDRFAEAGTQVWRLAGIPDLARRLRDTARGPIWLEKHPLLEALSAELEVLGAERHPGGRPLDTAVSVGLGLVPETGTVLVAAPEPLRVGARRQVVVLPPAGGSLDFSQALALTARFPAPLISWLTGPSRTADIEKILCVGAQGAAELLLATFTPENTESPPYG